MIQYLLYVGSKNQISEVHGALEAIGAKLVESYSGITKTFVFEHKFLKGMSLQIDLIDDLDGITPHLKRCHVDLLVYDERGDGSVDALAAILKIKNDIAAFANVWGPDFLFPSSRMSVILGKNYSNPKRSFRLGQMGIKDVSADPFSTGQILKWLQKILTKEFSANAKTGVALSGGGIEGFLFQLGVLHALEKSFSKSSIYDCEVFTGISSGSLAATIAASGVSTGEIILSLVGKSEKLPDFNLIKIFDFASADIGRRFATNLVSWAGLSPELWRRKLLQSIPSGFFKGNYLVDYFKTILEIYGCDDQFSSLQKTLKIGATNQDTYKHIVFGGQGEADPPISTALRASCSVPTFFTPVEFNGEYYIDGQITKTCNLADIVDSECKLCFIIDPFKPYGGGEPGENNKKGGYHSVVQTVKALVASRFEQSMAHVTERYPEVDFLVFQPDEECAKLMQGSPMKSRIRIQVIESAYKTTIRKLRDRYQVYQSILTKYGFELKPVAELEQVEHQLWERSSK